MNIILGLDLSCIKYTLIKINNEFNKYCNKLISIVII